MHYAVPRLLHASGQLERLHTDIYGKGGWQFFHGKLFPSGLRRLAGRVAAGVPPQYVRSYPAFGLAYFFRRRTENPEAADQAHLWAGRVFGKKVVAEGFGRAGAVYAFNTAALEILSAARQRGLFSVLEQTIAPRLVEEELLAEAEARYPGWEPKRVRSRVAMALAEREREEWKQADLIVCGSEFVRQGIARCGGPAERCVVVPYGVDSQFAPCVREARGGPLRVLTVGQVGLRKGAGSVWRVAKALEGMAEFRWAGPVWLREEARAELARHVQLTGPVPRNEIMKHYAWADVFFLPSICEGSATVTYEALACGLPVLTTPNAGSLVLEGEDGFVVAPFEVSAMSERLRELHGDRKRLQQLSLAAIAHAKEVSLAAYRERFIRLVMSPVEDKDV